MSNVVTIPLTVRYASERLIGHHQRTQVDYPGYLSKIDYDTNS